MEINIELLRDSKDFLNGLLDRINSAIFIVDGEVRVQDFNNSFIKLFQKDEGTIKNGLCGNIIGCYYAVSEKSDCGETSYCNKCELRKSILDIRDSYKDEDRNILKRKFKIGDEFVIKFLEYTVKKLSLGKQSLMMIILDDITDRQLNSIKLQNRNKVIENLNRNLLNDLEMAKKVQKQLLPEKLPREESMDCIFYYRPMDKLGGDFFDIRTISEDIVLITLFDVSGHGSPAALITTLIKGMLDSVSDLYMFPSQVANYINSQLCQLNLEKYVTMFYGIIDLKKKNITYVNCGHPRPVIVNKEIDELGDSTNMLLGFVDSYDFKSEVYRFKNKDRLYVFSDGLIEMSFNKRQLEEDILKTDLRGSDIAIKNVIADVNRKNKINDDICYIGIELK